MQLKLPPLLKGDRVHFNKTVYLTRLGASGGCRAANLHAVPTFLIHCGYISVSITKYQYSVHRNTLFFNYLALLAVPFTSYSILGLFDDMDIITGFFIG